MVTLILQGMTGSVTGHTEGNRKNAFCVEESDERALLTHPVDSEIEVPLPIWISHFGEQFENRGERREEMMSGGGCNRVLVSLSLQTLMH